MKPLKIESQFLEAEISCFGAELVTLRDKETLIDYIYEGDQKFWNRSAPVLFPFVGKLQNDSYRYGGKNYKTQRHGFARDLEFELISHQKDEVRLGLQFSQETLKDFPFKFKLSVTYKVYGPLLTTSFEVQNLEKRDMYFSIGCQPGFKIPITKGKVEDHFLEFEQVEYSGPYYLENELVDFESKPGLHHFQGKKILLSEKLFRYDSLVFKDVQSEWVRFRNTIDDHMIELLPGDAPYLLIWRPQRAPFLCIAPCWGIADDLLSDGDLLKKEGIIHLEAGSRFRTQFSFKLS